jgi:hypothetical protein
MCCGAVEAAADVLVRRTETPAPAQWRYSETRRRAQSRSKDCRMAARIEAALKG